MISAFQLHMSVNILEYEYESKFQVSSAYRAKISTLDITRPPVSLYEQKAVKLVRYYNFQLTSEKKKEVSLLVRKEKRIYLICLLYIVWSTMSALAAAESRAA